MILKMRELHVLKILNSARSELQKVPGTSQTNITVLSNVSKQSFF